ncbi:hypothetical protein TSUD_138010 [Trifolium subterraneum]|uniref:Uncharacterized protein n=1 Tax=Trifolium subterraneum TaxID=3900 RepID=A0A2Z6PHQ9_TRISU|nr:hypothetical protein TSUD_138010 [Trifolium subterraneum]
MEVDETRIRQPVSSMVTVPTLLAKEFKTQEFSDQILRKIGINCNLRNQQQSHQLTIVDDV